MRSEMGSWEETVEWRHTVCNARRARACKPSRLAPFAILTATYTTAAALLAANPRKPSAAPPPALKPPALKPCTLTPCCALKRRPWPSPPSRCPPLAWFDLVWAGIYNTPLPSLLYQS